jgi:hypothetical protein
MTRPSDRFHMTLEAERGSPEGIEIGAPIQRIWPQFFSGDEIGGVPDQPDASDHPLVRISKRANIGETHASEGRLAFKLP